MQKFKGVRLWFFAFAIQIFSAVIVSTAVLLLIPARNSPLNVEISGLVFDKAELQEIKETFKAYSRSILEDGSVIFESDGKHVKIPYHALDLRIDDTSVYIAMEKTQYSNRFFQLIGKTNQQFVNLKPEIYLNEAKYREAFLDFGEIFIKDKMDAGLVLEKGDLSITPHRDGYQLNIDKARDYILTELKTNLPREIVISESETPDLFVRIKPEITSDQLESYTQIYSMAQGEIPTGKTEAFRSLVNSLENKIVGPGQSFSYKERMRSSSLGSPLSELFASAVYQAILPVEDIVVTWRNAANQPVPGIEPGLEVNLEDDGDLQFRNRSELELVLVFDVNDSGKWTVALAGKPGLNFGVIRTEYARILPPVIYSQDNTLPENVEKVKEPGEEGLSVKVYRDTGEKTIQLYEDIYQPVYRIIAVGTGIKKEDIVRK